jgi:hypothetical protein
MRAIFQHNQQYDTLLPIIPCTHKLKAGIAYCGPITGIISDSTEIENALESNT